MEDFQFGNFGSIFKVFFWRIGSFSLDTSSRIVWRTFDDKWIRRRECRRRNRGGKI